MDRAVTLRTLLAVAAGVLVLSVGATLLLSSFVQKARVVRLGPKVNRENWACEARRAHLG